MADTTVAEINRKLKDLETTIQEFFDKINEVLSWVPDFLADVVKIVQQGLQIFNQKLQEFWDINRKFLENLGSVSSLRSKADQWEMTVARPIGDVAGGIALNKLRANIEWEGRAAEAYKGVVPSQGDGLTSLKTLARQVQSSLDSLANALTAFYVAVGAAVAVFAVGITGAIVACATAVGAPEGVAAGIQTAGVVIGLLTSAVSAVIAFSNSMATDQTALTQKIHDVGKGWPKSAIGDLSDGSVSDGDGSDWRVNQ